MAHSPPGLSRWNTVWGLPCSTGILIPPTGLVPVGGGLTTTKAIGTKTFRCASRSGGNRRDWRRRRSFLPAKPSLRRGKPRGGTGAKPPVGSRQTIAPPGQARWGLPNHLPQKTVSHFRCSLAMSPVSPDATPMSRDLRHDERLAVVTPGKLVRPVRKLADKALLAGIEGHPGSNDRLRVAKIDAVLPQVFAASLESVR